MNKWNSGGDAEEKTQRHVDIEANRSSIKGLLRDYALTNKEEVGDMTFFKCHEFCLQIKYEIDRVRFAYNIELGKSCEDFRREVTSALQELVRMGKLRKKSYPKKDFFETEE